MGCAASVRSDDALRRLEQHQLDLCRVRTKGPRKSMEGHTLGRPDPHTSGARRAPATQKPAGPKAPPANWTSVMPGMVIDGADTVDLNAALVEHTSSFLTERWPEPPNGIKAAFPPNRMTHEWHLAKLDRYLEKVENDPGLIGEAAGLKRWELEAVQGQHAAQ
ncbi:unnamed protein product [Durusdinium trenchii]|uniref:Uncharacterized protein n=1 Tax=Durusdinium trenchii TaxID=1381693 RepID=A0ABP0T0W5_9DINO